MRLISDREILYLITRRVYAGKTEKQLKIWAGMICGDTFDEIAEDRSCSKRDVTEVVNEIRSEIDDEIKKYSSEWY